MIICSIYEIHILWLNNYTANNNTFLIQSSRSPDVHLSILNICYHISKMLKKLDIQDVMEIIIDLKTHIFILIDNVSINSLSIIKFRRCTKFYSLKVIQPRQIVSVQFQWSILQEYMFNNNTFLIQTNRIPDVHFPW